MSLADMNEKGLEKIICNSLVNDAAYVQGDPSDYDREHAVDVPKLLDFLRASQPEVFASLRLEEAGPRAKFLSRLQSDIGTRGVVDVLRDGIELSTAFVDLYCATPSPGNASSEEQHRKNIFSVTRQVRFSRDETQRSLDFVIFINGLALATFELKNKITKQTYEDAINQYKTDRDPRELLFRFGRCAVHFALDESQVWMCTHLKGTESWFLPFNKGKDDGAGNPLNPNGFRTDYLWKEILAKPSLCDIIENYAQIIEEKTPTNETKRIQIFPRYHQLDCVRKILADAKLHGAGKSYLIQHSAGSGKSNSITWLALQLIGLKNKGQNAFDSILVVTDRVNLFKQIKDNIRLFTQEPGIVGAVTQGSTQLSDFLSQGKKIIITTVQTFPFALKKVGDDHRDRRFAIIIDEAHSSQGGKAFAAGNMMLAVKGQFKLPQKSDASKKVAEEPSVYDHSSSPTDDQSIDEIVMKTPDTDEELGDEITVEDVINRIIETRKKLKNASYFAFTATPKPKTLELFGTSFADGSDEKFRPFHNYTMKQAIQEGFILDVLKTYTTADSYYRLVKTVEDDPIFDSARAKKKLKAYVESNDHAIRRKAEIMIDHFHEQVIAKKKIGGAARAMVVCSSIRRAMQYKTAFDIYLKARKSPYKAIVAFSGDHEYEGEKGVTESRMNGFPSNKIEGTFQEEPYRFLIVADKFQTGYDEPLLHTMYCDKKLSGIQAVQTLSRLNRAHPKKHDTFVLDFRNTTDQIKESFADFYRTTLLSESTNPDKLNDLKEKLGKAGVYSWTEVQTFVNDYLQGVPREELEPQLEVCVDRYEADLDEDKQVEFKSRARAFVRTYGFLASILDQVSPNWERLSTFLNFLAPKLPTPVEEDLSKGILQTIDMDSYRIEVNAQLRILLPDADAEVDPANDTGGGARPPLKLDKLSSIVRTFNDQWGNIEWDDKDRVEKLITEEIPKRVAEDAAYKNACQNSDKKTARIEHDRAYQRVMNSMLQDHTKLYKHYSNEESFRNFAHETSFDQSYEGQRDRLGPLHELLIAHFQMVNGKNVTSRWTQQAGLFQRPVYNVDSLKKWVASARALVVEEQPLVPTAFGNVDVVFLIRVVDDRLHGLRPPRYQIERNLCQGAGVKSLDGMSDEGANRVQDWIAKQLNQAFTECASSRSRLTLEDWKKSLNQNRWTEASVEAVVQDAASHFQQAHDVLIENGHPGVFRKSSRTQMASAIGQLQRPISAARTTSMAVWKELFEFGERIIKLTSESLTERDGLKGIELLTDFRQKLGRSGGAALDLLFKLRCRGDHADDVSKRPEWEQVQHEVAKMLGRDKPKFSASSELLYRPDDLQLTPLEGNELQIELLDLLSQAFREMATSGGV